MALRLALMIALIALLPPASNAASSVEPGVAGVSSLIPGLGQALNDEPLEGLAWFTTIVGGLALSPGGAWPASAFMHLWMYNMYDAYRDAGASRSAKYSLLENYIAAFNPLNIVDPIGAPVVLLPALSGGKRSGPKLSSSKVLAPFEIAFIGLGEEGLFRGFVFPAFSDLTHSAVVGAVTSSMLFAYMHRFYAGQSTYALKGNVLAGRTILGLLMCLQTYMHDYDLRHSIFAHTWYDVVVDSKPSGGTLAGGSARSDGLLAASGVSGFVLKFVYDF